MAKTRQIKKERRVWLGLTDLSANISTGAYGACARAGWTGGAGGTGGADGADKGSKGCVCLTPLIENLTYPIYVYNI